MNSRFYQCVCGFVLLTWVTNSLASAAGGILNLTVHDEATGDPTTTRMEIVRSDKPDKPMPIRKTVSAGIGVVLDRSLELSLPDGGYQFRMIRGPEYRIIAGNFALEKTSLDDHNVDLPRMVDMQINGWTSGDCCVVASPNSLPLRMVSEDLHVAAVLGHVDANPVARRQEDDPPTIDPMWIREDAIVHDGLIFYGLSHDEAPPTTEIGSEWIRELADDPNAKVAVENPFAWPLPVWLASGRVDGFFVLGDWLRLDRKVLSVKDGRETQSLIKGSSQSVGLWAEQIHWKLLEAGFRIAPLAGGGDGSRDTPVGYNRLYVTESDESYRSHDETKSSPVARTDDWWRAAWSGQSVATNGPMLRPMLGGQIPGYVFTASHGEVLQLQPEVMLAVRDPVEYLEVIHNGQVHYSAKLDEFAKSGGVIPKLIVKESGWVTMRVVIEFDDHFRAAISSPWYIEFDGQPRITAEAVEFFQQWQIEYEDRLKRLPPEELAKHVPFVQAARAFWENRKTP